MSAPEPVSLASFGMDGAQALVTRFVNHIVGPSSSKSTSSTSTFDEIASIGLTALNAFLQANITGPVLENTAISDATFTTALEKAGESSLSKFRDVCLRSLDTDGVSVYPIYIPHVELFCLARWIFLQELGAEGQGFQLVSTGKTISWMRFRIHLWHYKFLSQPSISSGSLFTKAGRWTDVPSLQESVEKSMAATESTLVAELIATHRVEFLLEKANAFILLGEDLKAKEVVREATRLGGFTYALSGALGKRTRFQEKDISQLVVLAKSSDSVKEATAKDVVPGSLALNDDTLLEKIAFTSVNDASETTSTLPAALRGLTPDDQPQLQPEDQIILLTEATLKDTFSPADSLNSQEILPYAVRVLEDKSTNWQIYSQALLVRSRIELNRSRTVERGVLQMQAVVDQVIVDIESPADPTAKSGDGMRSIPKIEVTGANAAPAADKPTSFLPAARATESAPPEARLRYISQLLSPPRWHLEAELAYAWASVGSLVSALEIFKRLRLWAEVALCLASAVSTEDEDGRGSGGEEKAKAIIRWQLFNRTDGVSDDANELRDVNSMRADDYRGSDRDPAPANAPRLWCILGDIESEPAHYERAWEVSNRRFARAQRSLGELYLQRQQWPEAAKAYRLAVSVNRLSPEPWGRLGDIELRLGNFPDAAEAFQRSISSSNGEDGGEDARTWSNLGSALLSWYREIMKENKGSATVKAVTKDSDDLDADEQQEEASQSFDGKPATARAAELNKPAYQLLQDALSAFKRGATIASSNWRIWDNVVTLAASVTPKPALDDVILGTRNVLRLRKSEEAIDTEVLGLLVREATSQPAIGSADDAVFEPARGSLQSRVISLFDEEVIPLITTNSEAWALVSRLCAWRRDYAGALSAAEKGWRAAIGGVTGGSSLAAASSTSSQSNWLNDKAGWEVVVQRTSDLVAAYENWGSQIESIGANWKGKSRNAVRSVMSKGKEAWEGSEGWTTLERLLEDLRS